MNPSELADLPCYLNGEFTRLRDARISVMDRGFIFGDGIYEVVPVYAGRPFRFEQHMARMSRSLAELRIPNPKTTGEWRQLVDTLVDQYAAEAGKSRSEADQLVYIQVTRGVAMRDHAMVQGLTPTVFAMTNRIVLPSLADRTQGVSCVTAEDFRWKKAHIKSVSLVGAVLARQIGVDAGAAETIMFRDGFLSEGASANVWVAKGGRLLGAPNDNLILEGIRYGLIEELCADAGIPFALRPVSRDEVLGADELLLSNASKEIVPVTLLDGRPVGNGRPGPIFGELYAGYQRAKKSA